MLNSHSKLFEKIATLFRKHGFTLYMIGGTSRDFLLGTTISDYDLTTDATPEEMREFMPDAQYRFSMFGTVTQKFNGIKVEITTMREEGFYKDLRHPSSIKFVRDPKLDYVRRDFTINALYIDDNYNVLDFCNGQADLKAGLLKTIGEPNLRFREDPLRMYRALRFKVKLRFNLDGALHQALKDNAYLAKNLNKDKIRAERRKVAPDHIDEYDALCAIYNL